MKPLATVAQMKELDRIAIEVEGIPSLDLMEAAARGVVEAVMEIVEEGGHHASSTGIIGGASSTGIIGGASSTGIIGGASSIAIIGKDNGTPEEKAELKDLQAIVHSKEDNPGPRVAVLCGTGNNGGDGIAAARLLMGEGYTVRAFLVGDRAKMTPDSKAMEEKLAAAGGVLEQLQPKDNRQLVWMLTCDCTVDALFGIGLKRPVTGDFLGAVQMMNRGHAPVVSCDVPSGVDADTGEILGDAVRAKTTVTFTCGKPGLYLGEGGACAGEIVVTDIGIPHQLVHGQFSRMEEPIFARGEQDCRLPRRPRTAHKGDFGRVFVLAGSEGYTGAPVLTANAAVRTGAGLVYLGVPRDIYPIVAVKCDEAMPFPLPETYEEILERVNVCDVAVIGPGLGRKPETEELVLRLLEDLSCPVVLDADGINALSGHINKLKERTAPTILTPHDGEFARLTGCALPIENRVETARRFAKEYGCTLVLKGHRTITAASDGAVFINTTGNPGMAKGGSGDVLAGMMAALWGQRSVIEQMNVPQEVASMAVCLHGMAGDIYAGKLGEYAMTATDLIAALPEVLKESKW